MTSKTRTPKISYMRSYAWKCNTVLLSCFFGLALNDIVQTAEYLQYQVTLKVRTISGENPTVVSHMVMVVAAVGLCTDDPKDF